MGKILKDYYSKHVYSKIINDIDKLLNGLSSISNNQAKGIYNIFNDNKNVLIGDIFKLQKDKELQNQAFNLYNDLSKSMKNLAKLKVKLISLKNRAKEDQ